MIDDWRGAVPGDVVLIVTWASLELDEAHQRQVYTADLRPVFCCCIGREEVLTVHGLTVAKVYFLTPHGIGMKRFTVEGEALARYNRFGGRTRSSEPL